MDKANNIKKGTSLTKREYGSLLTEWFGAQSPCRRDEIKEIIHKEVKILLARLNRLHRKYKKSCLGNKGRLELYPGYCDKEIIRLTYTDPWTGCIFIPAKFFDNNEFILLEAKLKQERIMFLESEKQKAYAIIRDKKEYVKRLGAELSRLKRPN